MLPTVEERMDSVIRALSTTVLASIPIEEKLAREQVQLSIGHLSILREQIASLPQFEREALEDVIALARTLLRQAGDLNLSEDAARRLEQAVSEAVKLPAAGARRAINSSISGLIEKNFAGAGAEGQKKLMKIVAEMERRMASKEKMLFHKYGFDP